jgi:hypothetical protein
MGEIRHPCIEGAATSGHGMVSRWMEICIQKHKDCGEVVQSAILGLRLIDCGSRKVVPAPQRLRYITLSYVWGKGSSPPTHSEELPPAGSLPQTIEDSISLTCSSGFGTSGSTVIALASKTLKTSSPSASKWTVSTPILR